ncbi:hypothetical protein HUB98_07005 [Paenibacillus barcinonensis]|uniref:Uncharacterized protein n=1 Tax=Paenibacillus barcinonensis TaxID=198119 RepID=A0A2V4VE76_PAEBA|nr:hypothetical protein [Paenibacillus barcinonensis]PYE51768.1 hypothetical protein DFQ00_102564 [Paenibacillus barcinonensis]QKS56120.1 hypothetical protein HUB98_07005 [Paenibacillus barcinonensis]
MTKVTALILFFIEECAIIELMDNRVNDFTQGGVTYMMKTIPVYIGLCLLILAVLTSCTREPKPSEQPVVSDKDSANTITVAIDGSTFLPDATKSIKRDFSEGLTLKKALLNSGLVDFTADGKRIQSVGEVSLDSSLSWAVKLNGKDIKQENWDIELHAKDEVTIYVKAADSGGDGVVYQTTLLKVSGGSVMPNLKRQYAGIYVQECTVRDVLKSSGVVRMSENNKYVVAVENVIPRVNERWVIMVNNKELMENGLDMKLSPRDAVKLELAKVS